MRERIEIASDELAECLRILADRFERREIELVQLEHSPGVGDDHSRPILRHYPTGVDSLRILYASGPNAKGPRP